MLFNNSGRFFMGFAIGFGAGIVAREAAPHVAKAIRPLSKRTMKVAVNSLEKAREGFARLGEVLEDITEEVKFELASRVRKVVPEAKSELKSKSKRKKVAAGKTSQKEAAASTSTEEAGEMDRRTA